VSRTLLLDTSVAVAYIVADHDQHEAVTSRVEGCELGLAGHAAFEVYSVLTRLPAPLRRDGQATHRILASNFPASVFLSTERAASLLAELPAAGIAGGAVYDALVGAAAAEARLPLLTGDRRALETYRLLGVDVELVTPASKP
jgi:predicted nucleic acid-binding protein